MVKESSITPAVKLGVRKTPLIRGDYFLLFLDDRFDFESEVNLKRRVSRDRLILETVAADILELNPDGITSYINQAGAPLLGRLADEIQDRRLFPGFQKLHPGPPGQKKHRSGASDRA